MGSVSDIAYARENKTSNQKCLVHHRNFTSITSINHDWVRQHPPWTRRWPEGSCSSAGQQQGGPTRIIPKSLHSPQSLSLAIPRKKQGGSRLQSATADPSWGEQYLCNTTQLSVRLFQWYCVILLCAKLGLHLRPHSRGGHIPGSIFAALKDTESA